MKIDTHPGKLSLFWVLQISGWLLYGVIYYLVYYSYKHMNAANILGFSVTYIVAFFVTLAMRMIYKKLDYQHKSMLHVFGIIIVSSISFAIIWMYVDRVVSFPIHGIEWFIRIMGKTSFRENLSIVYWNSFILFTWSSLYFLINFWRQWNEHLLRTEKAELLAHSAQLQMLRYQLNPHFLFNSLNSIRALILEDQDKAREMVSELSELLRYSLISKNNGDVPFSEEIGAIKHYFAIEKKRFEENLQITLEVDPAAEDYPIPSFLVHPLVENAVKYGMKTSKMPLKISVIAKVSGSDLTIFVRNSGKWLSDDDPSRSRPMGTGTGLKNVKERLENRFPDNYELTNYEEDDCVVVKIAISRTVTKHHD